MIPYRRGWAPPGSRLRRPETAEEGEGAGGLSTQLPTHRNPQKKHAPQTPGIRSLSPCRGYVVQRKVTALYELCCKGPSLVRPLRRREGLTLRLTDNQALARCEARNGNPRTGAQTRKARAGSVTSGWKAAGQVRQPIPINPKERRGSTPTTTERHRIDGRSMGLVTLQKDSGRARCSRLRTWRECGSTQRKAVTGQAIGRRLRG